MRPLTENELRASFVNASKGEAKRATLPDLDAIDWDRLDYLGWIDVKRDQQAYVAFVVDGEGHDAAGAGDGDGADVDAGAHAGEVRVVMLRRSPPSKERRRMMCSWCQDMTATHDVTMYVAPRAGARGRLGNTVGTSICTNFSCARNVRRVPNAMEVQNDDERAAWQAHRIAQLRERSMHFLDLVMAEQ